MHNQSIRLLYVVGGPKAAPRVDVAVLFGQYLSKDVFDIDWVIFDPKPGAPAWKRKKWLGSRAYWVGRSSRNDFMGSVLTKLFEFSADMRTAFLALTGDYKIIQVRDKFLVAILCLIAAKLRGRFYTYWLSYPFPESRISDARERRAKHPGYSWFAGKLSGLLLYKIILPLSTHVFVQSEQMRQDVHSQGISLEKMTPVPMGVDEILITVPAEKIRENTILYLGTLVRVRRLEILIEALLILKNDLPHENLKLIFVGDGDTPADRAYLEDITNKNSLNDIIEFTGHLPMEKALEKVSSAAVCVSPFYPTFVLRSTSPTKLVEYMALGRPVVANDHPEQAEIIEKSGGGICVKWSAQSFAKGIREILEDPEGAEEMGIKGKNYVQSNRTYSPIAKKVMNVYQKKVLMQ
ncbi:MAG: glycosyltransferase [Desulfobacterales bacterium]|nr:glycosyltransferase [Desulfobacterales bacterium]